MKKIAIQMDLDDTIYRKEQYFSKKTLETLNRLHIDGYYLILNSGRPVNQLLKVVDYFDIRYLFDFIIGSNGAEYLDVNTNEYTMCSYLKPELIKEIYYEYKDLDIALCLYDDKFLTNKLTETLIKRANQIKLEPMLIDYEQLNKSYTKLLGIIDPNDREEFINIISKVDNENYDVYFSGYYLIEFVAKGSSKARGLKNLLDSKKLNDLEVYSFGDNANDIAMLKETIGVMMGYDNEILKDVAKYATDTCDKDGFCKFINEHFYK